MMMTEPRLMVSPHSHPKVAASDFKRPPFIVSTFQHTATRRWLPFAVCGLCESVLFQHTATRRWLLETKTVTFTVGAVSTHSHPKVAANDRRHCGKAPRCFNTQPPEGGCAIDVDELILLISFNTQPPEGGCLFIGFKAFSHASFNTQPPEGGCQFYAI